MVDQLQAWQGYHALLWKVEQCLASKGRPVTSIEGGPVIGLEGKPVTSLEGGPVPSLKGRPVTSLEGGQATSLEGGPVTSLDFTGGKNFVAFIISENLIFILLIYAYILIQAQWA